MPLPTSSRDARAAELAAAAAASERKKKPSSAWRHGYMLYDGWPAQEGGPESSHNTRRSTHSLIAPAVTLEDAAARPEPEPPVDARAASWAARYPAWWTEGQTVAKAATIIEAWTAAAAHEPAQATAPRIADEGLVPSTTVSVAPPSHAMPPPPPPPPAAPAQHQPQADAPQAAPASGPRRAPPPPGKR